MFKKFREQGDGSSAAPGVTEPAPSEVSTPEPAPSTDQGGEQPTVAELQEKITGLNKIVGDQGNEIGVFKKAETLTKQELDTNRAFMDQLKKSPAETLKSLGLAAGLTVTAPSAELTKTGDPAADQTAEINSIVQKALADNMGPVNTIMSTVQESHLAAKFGDAWDTLAQVRQSNMARIQAGHIPTSELAHMVSEFERLPEHIAAARLEGREELRAELEKKAGQHLPDGSGQEPHKIPENEQTAAHGAKRLGNMW